MKRAAFACLSLFLVTACSGDDGGGGSGTEGTESGSDSATDSGGSGTGGDQDQIARGEYLVNNVGQCSFCHTPRLPSGAPDPSMFLAGNACFEDTDPMDDNVGCISTRNLTNHETGLANATDEEIIGAFRDGIGTDGRNLLPIMPYWVFHNMTDDDAQAIVAYLRTLPGVDNMTPPSQDPWVEPPAPLPPIDPNVIPEPDMNSPVYESAMNGRYLATMASLCVDCHTPEITPMMFDFDWTKIMAGGRGFPKEAFGFLDPNIPDIVYTSNLTPHASGLEGYTVDDIVKVMKEGVNPNGEGVCAPTHSGPASPYAGLTDQDVLDIANYLTTLPAIDNMVPEECVAPPP